MYNTESIPGSQSRLARAPSQSGLPTSPSTRSLRSGGGEACHRLTAEMATQDRRRSLAERGFKDLTEGLAALGFAAAGEIVMVPPGAVRRVNEAIDLLDAEGFRAGQVAPNDRVASALVTLHNLRAIRGIDYEASCEARVRQTAARQVASDANRDGGVNRSRWRGAVQSFMRTSRFFPQTPHAGFFLATLPLHFWGAIEYTLYGGAKMADPSQNKRLIGYQMGVLLPMGLIPALAYVYLRLNKEALDRRRAAMQDPPPNRRGPHNV